MSERERRRGERPLDDHGDEKLELELESSTWSGPRAPTDKLKRTKAKEVARAAPQATLSLKEEDGSVEDSRYPTRVRKPPGEWWTNHMPVPQEKERANLAVIEEPQSRREAMQSSDANKWELAMQEYASLLANGT